MYLIEFSISAVLIILAGTRLTTYADKLSEHLQLGKVWIGIALLGLVTSLPEAVTCIVSVVKLHANDLAIGNLLGSNNFNPLLVVVMDAVYRQGSITNEIEYRRSHRDSALFAIFLVLIVLADIILSRLVAFWQIGFVSFGTIGIFIFYILAMRHLSRSDAADIPHVEVKDDTPYKVWANIIVSAVVVVAAAMWLAKSADIMAEATGLGRTFVGSIFLAIVTSLPEMVVTLSAVKLGSYDLAIGNIFGSNITNVFIVSICELFFIKGPILATVSLTHCITIVLSIILVGLCIVGIKVKNKRTFFGLGWDSILMAGFFLAGTSILYQLR